MDSTETTNALLRQILEELQLLTVTSKMSALKKFQKEFLTTDGRKQIYAGFDGKNTFQQISDITGQKRNTVQIFAQALVDKNLVDVILNGTSKIISKSPSKIAVYYASIDLANAGTTEE